VLQSAKKGDMIIVTGKERDGWVPVYYLFHDAHQRAKSVIGYVPADNIFIDDGVGTKPPNTLVAPQGEAITMHKNAFLKSGRYNSSRFNLKEIKEGERFIKLAEPTEKGWIKAWFDGVEGWMAVRDVKLE